LISFFAVHFFGRSQTQLLYLEVDTNVGR